MAKFDPYEHVTQRIVDFFESSTRPDWQAPWQGTDIPANAITGRGYNGINVMLLWLRMQEETWEHSLFLTYKQTATLGKKHPDETCHVRKGSTSESICFWNQIKFTNKDGEEETKPMLRMYRVFNVDQIECSDKIRKILIKKSGQASFEFEDERDQIVAIEEYLEALGSDVTHAGSRAFYRISDDTLTMPKMETFKSSEAYYGTRLHEESHRTGHSTRCDRDLKNRFGSDAYAFEEMVAEITAAFLCCRFQFTSELQHPDYVKHWCKRMKGDKYAIFKAASLAKASMKWMDDQQDDDQQDDE